MEVVRYPSEYSSTDAACSRPIAFAKRRVPWAAVLFVVTLAMTVTATGVTQAIQPPQVLTRVFFVDRQTQVVKWAELLAGERPQMTAVKSIAGFPTLDPAQQEIIGLEVSAGMLLVAVAAREPAAARGWLLVECGAYEEAHGDHSHWIYPIAPRVRAMSMDTKQQNPTRLLQQAGAFFWTYQGGGFARLDPSNIASNATADSLLRRVAVHAGGDGVALAAIANVVAFAGGTGTEGGNAGRVDVALLKSAGNDKLVTSVKLAAAPVEQMATTYNRVFVSGGGKLEWFAVPSRIAADASQYPVQSVLDDGNPTEANAATDGPLGPMSVYGRYVAFCQGTGSTAAFCSIDAAVASPRVRRVSLNATADARPGRFELMRNRRGQPLALVFLEAPAAAGNGAGSAAGNAVPNPAGKSSDRLAILELDPNRDGDWADAKLAATVAVGHHAENANHVLSVDADQRRAVYSNPGDGTIMIFSLDDRQTINGFKVGGQPTEVRAVGGRVSNH